MEGEGEILKLVNKLLEQAGRTERVHTLGQCNDDLVYSLYGELFAEQVAAKPLDEAAVYQMIINGLSEILPPEISLSHITGSNIASGDTLSLRNLLQILHELFNIKEKSDDNILQQTSLSSSLCTDDTLTLLQVNAISRRVAIAKRELSSSSSGSRSHDAMRTPSPHRHSSSFNPLLMSTPHPPAKSRLEGVANNWGVDTKWSVPEEVESISSINSEVGMASSETIPSLTITTISSSTTGSHDDVSGSHDVGTHDMSDNKALGSCDSSDAVTTETDDDTIVDQRTNLKQIDVKRGVSGSHDTETDSSSSSSTAEESSHDPGRSAILNKIYQKYVKDTTARTQKRHRPRKKKLKHTESPCLQQPRPPSGIISAFSSSDKPATPTLVTTLAKLTRKLTNVTRWCNKGLSGNEIYHELLILLLLIDDLMNVVKGEFPFLQLSPTMARQLWQKQLHQVKQLSCPLTSSNPAKKVQEAEQRQRALLGIIRKELTQQQRMEEQQHRRLQQQIVKAKLHSRKMATVRTKKYYRDYELRLKAKMQRKRTREEQVFQKALEEGLELQRNRIRELQRFAKEKRSEEVKKHAEQLESLENYYRDQFMLLAEEIANEKAEKEIRGQAQQQLVERMKRELRQKMEEEIQSLQECIDREDDDVHFRQLDAEQFLSHKLHRLKLCTLRNTIY